MKVTFEFEHPYQLVDMLEVLTKAALERTCCEIEIEPELEPEPEQRFIDGDGNIYTADEINDILIDSDGIGAP